MKALRWLGSASTLIFLACTGPTPAAPPARAPGTGASASPARTAQAPSSADEVDPKRAIALADGIYRDQLAVQGRDERFSTDRQVAELRRAIGLYQQFIERAEGDPTFAEAVKRSRDRIKDAEETIAFLLSENAAADR
jgi:hypothetical protein